MHIGGVKFSVPVWLAPMSGVSDLPFRRLAMRFGAGAVVSEMIACEQLSEGEDEALLKVKGDEVFSHIVQLAGREAKWMALGAKIARDNGADIIDINMGCPAKKVTSGYSGSALMKDLDHALTLIEATVKAVDCPVTLKMRLGWDDKSLNAADLAQRAEEAGVQMVTVHGRTRCQFYKGMANWPAIGAIKESISIPLIANGDVKNACDAENILETTKASGVMIGRGAYGKPWLVGHVGHYLSEGNLPTEPEGAYLVDVILEHYEMLLEHYGLEVGLRAARKHLSWYLEADKQRLKHTPLVERKKLLTSYDMHEVKDLIRIIFNRSFEKQKYQAA